MNLAKFDLYNSEWLEIVFDDRNKMYGAYDLRKHYASNMVKAMGIAFFSVALLYTGYEVLKPKPVAYVAVPPEVPVILTANVLKHEVIVPPKPEVNRPQVHTTTVKYPVLVVTRDEDAQNPPKLTELTEAAIGTKTEKGVTGDNSGIDDLGTGTGPTVPNLTEDNTPVDMRTVEVEPQPYGGAEGWAKFLQKNMHYPPVAVENNVQGKVYLSFIVEKDGKLSNIQVIRGAGSGLDEEATRVLKIAPAWKPGIQNGHPVRVKYTIPINFQLSDPNN